MSRTLPPPALPNAPGELRQDPIGGGWVAITAGRAARPEAFLGDVGSPRGPLGCPFCPGNEHLTPPEVWADRDPGTGPDRPGWHVRVVPNKFPAFAGPPAAAHRNGGLYRSEPTAGVHGVVIHNPDHEATLAGLPDPAVARVMAAWRRRLAAHRDPSLGAVLIIVNQGRTAGASLEHPPSGTAPGWSARPASCSPSAPGRRRPPSRPCCSREPTVPASRTATRPTTTPWPPPWAACCGGSAG
jgi:galactose-1-phosphate uridylyltransferase